MMKITPDERYAESTAMLARAERVIPLGTQTFSKSKIQFPVGQAPLFLSRGKGGRVWDVDGNEYVDLVMGLLPLVLGYRDPDVDLAIREQLEKGISFSLATELEIKLAELLVEIIPCAEMVRFGKNGSDATSAAVRIARAATGRDRIAAGGYHGWHDWYIGATVLNKGIPQQICELTHKFPYNDVQALHALLQQYPGEFAAVIMEPANVDEPHSGYLQEVQELTHKNGALFILDEIITGFRFALGGAQELFRLIPDLATFGKALGNGMPIAAVVGKAEYMGLLEDIFFSSTFGGEALSIAASLAVIEKMRREPVIECLWNTGKSLADKTDQKITSYGLDSVISLQGFPPWKILAFKDHPRADKDVIKTFFVKEMLQQGVLINASHNLCYAHTIADLEHIQSAYDTTLARLIEELDSGDLEKRLQCPVIKPVFSVR